MPEYVVAKSQVYKNGKMHRVGDAITLTEEQAEVMGDRLVPFEVANPGKAISEMKVKELKALAKVAGITGYSTMDHDALVAALEALAVNQDESVSD